MIKVSISGTSERKAEFDGYIANAIEQFLAVYPAESIKTNWRKERVKHAPVEADVPLPLEPVNE